jgi:glycosyltransferase involved in cell wall biosynthesis
MSSEREQFGLVLIEGMACGLPAVATRSLGPATIVEEGRTGWLVELGDQTALEAALTAVVDDPRERERRGRAARAAVRERFAWSSVAAQLVRLLEEVDAHGRPARAVRIIR